MQAGSGRAPLVAGDQRADLRAASHGPARADRRVDRLVRRPQTAGVVEADHRTPGHHAREHHHPVARGHHREPRCPGEVGAPVPGAVPVRRRLERPGHRRTGQGSGPEGTGHHGPSRRDVGRRRDRAGERHRQQRDEERAGAHVRHPPGGSRRAGRTSGGCGSASPCGQSTAKHHVCCGTRPVSTGRLRASFSRPSAGQSPPRSRPRRGSGAARAPGRSATRRLRDNRGARPVAARRSERLQWQSSA